MSQKLPVNGLNWIEGEELSYFNEDFIKTMMKMVIQVEVDINYPKELFHFHKDLPFLPESKKVSLI